MYIYYILDYYTRQEIIDDLDFKSMAALISHVLYSATFQFYLLIKESRLLVGDNMKPGIQNVICFVGRETSVLLVHILSASVYQNNHFHTVTTFQNTYITNTHTHMHAHARLLQLLSLVSQ